MSVTFSHPTPSHLPYTTVDTICVLVGAHKTCSFLFLVNLAHRSNKNAEDSRTFRAFLLVDLAPHAVPMQGGFQSPRCSPCSLNGGDRPSFVFIHSITKDLGFLSSPGLQLLSCSRTLAEIMNMMTGLERLTSSPHLMEFEGIYVQA